MKRKNQMSLTEAIDFWFYSTGMKEKIFQFELREVWNKMMNGTFLSNTQKIKLKETKAMIYLDSMVLVIDFKYQKEKIKSHINKELKKFQLTELDFKFQPKKIKNKSKIFY